MDEKEFIYGRLKYLTESVEFLISTIEKQQISIETLTSIIGAMQSPEYASKQAKLATSVEVAEKIALMKRMMNKSNN